jgi:hypothetical protein
MLLIVLLALGLLVLVVYRTLSYLPLPITGDTPPDVVARALGVRPFQVKPAFQDWPQPGSESPPWLEVDVDDTPQGGSPQRRRVLVSFAPDGKSLSLISWLGGQGAPATHRNCTQAEAEALVRRTYRRAFGRWPEGLQLANDKTYTPPDAPLRSFRWERVVKPGVVTGTWVSGNVSLETGKLDMIARATPVEHHELYEARVRQQDAEQTALQQVQSVARADDIVDLSESRLVLNFAWTPPRPPGDDGPVWLVTVDNHGARPEWPPHPYVITVDAVTGQSLTKLDPPHR